MENELNYLSEQVEDIECEIHLYKNKKTRVSGKETIGLYDAIISRLENKIIIYTNILNFVTEKTIE